MSFLSAVQKVGEAHYVLPKLAKMQTYGYAVWDDMLDHETGEPDPEKMENADFGVTGIYEVKHIDLDADDFLRPALALWKRKHDEVIERRQKMREEQERQQLARLQEKYGQEG